MRDKLCILLLLTIVAVLVKARPPQMTPVVASKTIDPLISDIEEDGIVEKEDSPNQPPIISDFTVRSDIQYRYAKTVVESLVKNPNSQPQEIVFTMIIPDDAFISNFSMIHRDQEYVAKVEEKEEAQKVYDEAVAEGQSAGIVNQDTRDANKITISANVGPTEKIRFRLTYEELLHRSLSRYEHVIHVNPGQIVDNFVVDVYIDESLPVSHVKVPKFKTDPNAITSGETNPYAKIMKDPNDPSKVHVRFSPSGKDQKDLQAKGLSGQFIVEYDVDRKENGNDIQLIDGYFVHFFAPEKLETLPKHVIFVLDLSGSMYGEKLQQTKDAMVTILDDLTEEDHFNIITFSDAVYHWVPENEKVIEGPHNLTYRGTQDTRNEALTYVLGLQTIGGTNINQALLDALQRAKDVQQSETLPPETKPIVIFLTDGEATTGVVNSESIKENVRKANGITEVPIYALAFGAGADFSLLKEIAVENKAFARRIYEGSDASFQLEDFYLEIASPLLSGVEFNYVGELNATKGENETDVPIALPSVTATKFNTFNKGNEIVIAGKINADADLDAIEIGLSGLGANGVFEQRIRLCFPPVRPIPLPEPVPLNDEEQSDETVLSTKPGFDHPIIHPVFPDGCFPLPKVPERPKSEAQSFVERLWAFLTIKDLLKKAKDSEKDDKSIEDIVDSTMNSDDDDKETGVPDVGTLTKKPKTSTNREKALDLALKYNFVTPITSLVVVKPSENDTEEEVKEPIDPVPVQEVKQGFASMRFGFRVRSKAGSASQVFNQAVVNRQHSPAGMPGRPFPSPNQGLFLASTGHSSQPMKMLGQPGGGSSTRFQEDDFVSSDYDAEDSENSKPTTSTTPKTSCSGSLILFRKTHHRVPLVTLTEDNSDLSEYSDSVSSMEVIGDCCWRVFQLPNFQGESFDFNRPNAYKSPTEFLDIFRQTGSVQRLITC